MGTKIKQALISMEEFCRRREISDDQAAFAQWRAVLWGSADGFLCPRCGHGEGYALACRRCLIECKACRHQASGRAKTIMHSSKLPLGVWFYSAHVYLANQAITALAIARLTGVHWRTARGIKQRLKKALMQGQRPLLEKMAAVN